MTGLNLDAQGLYYDEVHQAIAAFDYKGNHPTFFNVLQIGRVPILNMTYSGALKSNLYSLYLALGASFSVSSWRLLGIGFVAASLFLFCIVAGRCLPRRALFLFVAALLTDTTVLLTTRHDWGPTALGLALRVLFIAVWIRRELDLHAHIRDDFLLGSLVGLALFEKLSAVVLLVPLVLLLILSLRPRTRHHWLAGLAGFALGALPLLVANGWSYLHGEGVISLAEIQEPGKPALPTLGALLHFASDYLSLGQGVVVRNWILGQTPELWPVAVEVGLWIGLTAWIAVHAIRAGRTDAYRQMAGVAMLCYWAVAAGLVLLPRSTGVHHWISGTPFQYVALALTFAGRPQRETAPAGIPWRRFMPIVPATLAVLIVRAPGVLAVEGDLVGGRSGLAYDPGFSRLGEFAAAHINEAVFVAADWGMGNQIYCLANGPATGVYEPFWDAQSARNVLTVIAPARKQILYLITRRKTPRYPDTTALILKAVTSSPDWREVQVEPEVAALRPVRVRKFLRRAMQSNPFVQSGAATEVH
ncbi:MAG: hypothetical protein ACR2M0_05410 [Chloroflexia bacterium]